MLRVPTGTGAGIVDACVTDADKCRMPTLSNCPFFPTHTPSKAASRPSRLSLSRHSAAVSAVQPGRSRVHRTAALCVLRVAARAPNSNKKSDDADKTSNHNQKTQGAAFACAPLGGATARDGPQRRAGALARRSARGGRAVVSSLTASLVDARRRRCRRSAGIATRSSDYV